MSEIDDKLVARVSVEQALARVGVAPNVVDSALDSIHFPAPLSLVCLRLEHVGITTGQLVDWMGASP
jgi:hypothetical protein